jgi:hypothetical protein
MIFLFTDFGREGPYVGQVQAVLARAAPGVAVIELMSDLPAFDPKAAAYLLPAYARQSQPGDVVIAVVDPGVGSDRLGVVLRADGVWYVGPDNGLLALVARRARATQAWALPPAPASASASFHGRDVFAPVAADLAVGRPLDGARPIDAPALDRAAWPNDLGQVVYIDRYGNAVTGLRAANVGTAGAISVMGRNLRRCRTFADAAQGEAFCYTNANGLLEVALNGANAAENLCLQVGTPISINL